MICHIYICNCYNIVPHFILLKLIYAQFYSTGLHKICVHNNNKNKLQHFFFHLLIFSTHFILVRAVADLELILQTLFMRFKDTCDGMPVHHRAACTHIHAQGQTIVANPPTDMVRGTHRKKPQQFKLRIKLEILVLIDGRVTCCATVAS